jgi:peptide deformylase
MTIKIVTIGDPSLRRKARTVTDFAAARTVADTLVSNLRELKGAGLAANQVGIDLNIFVAEVRPTELFPDREQSGLHVIVNAEILEHSPETNSDWEGCFSVPGLLGSVNRYNWITIRYDDLDGKKHTETIGGYLARVFQHEMDHLSGKFYLDRMQTMLSLTTRENYLARVESERASVPKNPQVKPD